MAAFQRAQRFTENATVALLKEKLAELNVATTGAKVNLKARLLEEIQKLSEGVLQEHFPENILDMEGSGIAGGESVSSHDDVSNDDDHEFEALRNKLQRKKEIAELRKQIAELDVLDNEVINSHSRTVFNFRDVEESLCQFSGDDHYCVRKWINDFDESADTLGWGDKTRFVYAKRLLVGTAKLYLRTISPRSWNNLKAELISEFSSKATSAEIHNKLRQRKKEKSETLQRYVLAMHEISSLASTEEADLIQYIIDGIHGSEQSKILLYGANSMAELKSVLKKFERVSSSYNDHSAVRQPERKCYKQRNFSRIKCFNCNEVGHMGSECTRPRRPKGSCFKCGSMRHMAHRCDASKSTAADVQHKNQQQRTEGTRNFPAH